MVWGQIKQLNVGSFNAENNLSEKNILFLNVYWVNPLGGATVIDAERTYKIASNTTDLVIKN